MLKPLASICVLSCALLVNVQAASPTDPVAIVNGKTVTQQDYDNYVKLRAEQSRSSAPVDSKVIIEELVNRELILQDAANKKLDKTPEFLKRLESARYQLTGEAAVRDYLDKHPVDDAALRKEYDKRIAETKLPKEYNAKHILLKTEDEAKAIIAELEKGKVFADLARDKSIDKGSAEKNGELGWITQQDVVPAFGEALAKLEKGKYSTTPVKSDFGWHVIQLDDIRDAAPPAFEMVKENVKALVQRQQVQDYIAELKKPAKVEILKKDEPPAKVDTSDKDKKADEAPKPAKDAAPK